MSNRSVVEMEGSGSQADQVIAARRQYDRPAVARLSIGMDTANRLQIASPDAKFVGTPRDFS